MKRVINFNFESKSSVISIVLCAQQNRTIRRGQRQQQKNRIKWQNWNGMSRGCLPRHFKRLNSNEIQVQRLLYELFSFIVRLQCVNSIASDARDLNAREREREIEKRTDCERWWLKWKRSNNNSASKSIEKVIDKLCANNACSFVGFVFKQKIGKKFIFGFFPIFEFVALFRRMRIESIIFGHTKIFEEWDEQTNKIESTRIIHVLAADGCCFFPLISNKECKRSKNGKKLKTQRKKPAWNEIISRTRTCTCTAHTTYSVFFARSPVYCLSDSLLQ